MLRSTKPFLLLALLSAFFSSLLHAEIVGYVLKGNTLHVNTDTSDFTVSVAATNSFVVTLKTDDSGKAYANLPSMALAHSSMGENINPTVEDTPTTISLNWQNATVNIDKASHRMTYLMNGKQVVKEQKGLSVQGERISASFSLDDSEKIYGGGQRVLGMDRRGQQMPLYNKAHYGYTTSSSQMYFGLSAVMSSKHYAVLFDNTASGTLDIGASNTNELLFQADGGRASYVIVLGESVADTVQKTVSLTGKQPLPPRWLLGNFASRFGYKSQQEVIDVVGAFNQQDIPVDAVVLDLYWFGKDVKGHMGNLQWDNAAFPEPEQMIAQLKQQDVKTVLITEPFILTSSAQWESAVLNDALVKKADGAPYTFDFYFGNTGLVDVFSEAGQDWFWQFYEKLAAQGVAGWWGDLGEPEVHPDDSIHLWDSKPVLAKALHNGYGHQWAKLVYSNLRKLQPETRPFVLMRSGFLGSQRYGMVPWTGDVSRSWGGLAPQVELALQMSIFGLAYTHSDLGGFAGGDAFDPELYTRWLQFGAFTPVFRPHAQDSIAPEPIFHPDPVKSIVREFIKLRYAMLPYNYGLAFENALSGSPLMRPLSYVYSDDKWFDHADSYMWGDALLVSPVTQPKQSQWNALLPEGVWFDFFSGERFVGDQEVAYPLRDDNFPVWVKAGSFIPMSEGLSRTEDYDPSRLTMHYWFDNSVASSGYTLYEDNGKSPYSVDKNTFATIEFKALRKGNSSVMVSINSDGSYIGMPQQREFLWVVHGFENAPKTLRVNGRNTNFNWNENKQTLTFTVPYTYQQAVDITIN